MASKNYIPETLWFSGFILAKGCVDIAGIALRYPKTKMPFVYRRDQRLSGHPETGRRSRTSELQDVTHAAVTGCQKKLPVLRGMPDILSGNFI